MGKQSKHNDKTTASGRNPTLEQAFLAFINDNRLCGPADRVLLAVSGGIDSMVMADLFYQTGLPFAIAHVNFGLRGAESDADADFVQNKAEQYEVPFHLTRFDTNAVAHERNISIQMAARDLRYAWFAQLVDANGYASLATAHHKNDVLETLLFNLTRGTGLAGLHGIAPRQEKSVAGVMIRPLLFATRDDLANYARERGIAYREDRSNSDDKYARNRIRHHVVPILIGLNPGLWEGLPRTIERLRAAESLMKRQVEQCWNEVAEQQTDRVLFSADKLLQQPEPAFLLAEWLKPFGFGTDQVKQMIESLARPVGQVFETATHRITHDRLNGKTGLMLEQLRTRPTTEIFVTDWPTSSIAIADLAELTVLQLNKPPDFRPPAHAAIACLDASLLIFPLVIRPWQRGDRFWPLGLNGRKLVSDLLNDLKLTYTERQQVMVLASGGEIVWVIGHRINHRFRITENTTQVAQFIWDSK
ncbi:tRNA lysidine(34) synthetase TilS [Spirosoma sp. SC4-14]|uniref:tRNA lysidine(34) synthetase TilS n=1 Tax=Spirosoma sp. SC4-14 TaxID=3128900 RepID=UPI0030CDB884